MNRKDLLGSLSALAVLGMSDMLIGQPSNAGSTVPPNKHKTPKVRRWRKRNEIAKTSRKRNR